MKTKYPPIEISPEVAKHLPEGRILTGADLLQAHQEREDEVQGWLATIDMDRLQKLHQGPHRCRRYRSATSERVPSPEATKKLGQAFAALGFDARHVQAAWQLFELWIAEAEDQAHRLDLVEELSRVLRASGVAAMTEEDREDLTSCLALDYGVLLPNAAQREDARLALGELSPDQQQRLLGLFEELRDETVDWLRVFRIVDELNPPQYGGYGGYETDEADEDDGYDEGDDPR